MTSVNIGIIQLSVSQLGMWRDIIEAKIQRMEMKKTELLRALQTEIRRYTLFMI